MPSLQFPLFFRRAQRDLVLHSKIYLSDVGVYQTLRPRGPFDTQSEVNGIALEGLVAFKKNYPKIDDNFTSMWKRKN